MWYYEQLQEFPGEVAKLQGGSRSETAIFCIISGIAKLSKGTPCSQNRGGYCGLCNIIKSKFQEGVECGFLSSTSNRNMALRYSRVGRDTAATILEMESGEIDIEGQIDFVSQCPGEDKCSLLDHMRLP